MIWDKERTVNRDFVNSVVVHEIGPTTTLQPVDLACTEPAAHPLEGNCGGRFPTPEDAPITLWTGISGKFRGQGAS